MPSLLWFRRDLRLRDLPALSAAVEQDREVLGCFVLDPRLETSSSARRRQFMGDCLRQLRADLDGRLLVTLGRPEERIPLIAREIDATAVHISADFTPFGQSRDERVQDALGAVPLIRTGSPYLVSPGRVMKGDGTAYRVFTPYFRQWLDHGWRSLARTESQSADWLEPTALSAAVARPADIPDVGAPLGFIVGETAARQQWRRSRPESQRPCRVSAPVGFS